MKHIPTILLCGVLSIGLAGCDTMSKQDVGVVTGGVVGGLVGSQFGGGSGRVAAAALGAVAGALIGGQIGKYMDRQDQMRVQRTLETTPTHRSISWQNPDSGNRYTVTPTKTYKQHNTYCREYLTKAVINGKEQKMYGKACRQPDGSWKAVSQKYKQNS